RRSRFYRPTHQRLTRRLSVRFHRLPFQDRWRTTLPTPSRQSRNRISLYRVWIRPPLRRNANRIEYPPIRRGRAPPPGGPGAPTEQEPNVRRIHAASVRANRSFHFGSPVGASRYSSPCFPLRSILTRRPAPRFGL